MTDATQAHAIGPGTRVRMHYSITLEDGTVADSTFEEDPIEFVFGDGTLQEGLELAILGLHQGDTQTLRIGPEVGFGYHDPDNVHLMSRDDFPTDLAVETGQIIGFTTPGGDEIPGMIKSVDEAGVQVDFNHPLAGHEIRFDVEILAIEPPADTDPEAP